VKSKSTVKELMVPEVRMVKEKPERETITTATEEDEEEVVLLALKAVKIVPKLPVTKKNLKANVVVVEVAVTIELAVVEIKVKIKSRLPLQEVKIDPRELEEIAEEAEVVEVTNSPELKVMAKTLMARTESRTKISLNSK